MISKRGQQGKHLSAHETLDAAGKTAVRLIASIKATGKPRDLAENHNIYLYGKPTE